MRATHWRIEKDNDIMKVQLIRSVKEDTTEKTGIGYYADYLEDLLEDMGSEVETIPIDLGFKSGIGKALYEMIAQIVKMMKGRKDTQIVHVTADQWSLFLPFANGKRIVTFHHVVKRSEINTIFWGSVCRLSVMIARLFADEFIAISPLTKKEMVEYFNIPAEKITVAIHPPKSEMYRENVSKEKVVAFVGSLINRKNPDVAVKVFGEMLKKPEFLGYKLIMCGSGHCKEKIDDLISEMGLAGSVEIINNLSVEEIRMLYSKSRFLLNTSSFEGLGITTLEAQMCGTPVLYFEDAEMPPEVMVAAIPCRDVTDMVDKAAELIADSARMTEVIDFGMKYSTEFGKDYKEKLKYVYNKN